MDLDEIKNSGSDSYVVDGAGISCTLGAAESTLCVGGMNKVGIGGGAQATIKDAIPMMNIKPFGSCKRSVPPPPCIPSTTVWINGKPDVMINGANALLKSSTCVCMMGGIITLKNDGQ